MKNINFTGLEKALDDGCYIKVFSSSMHYPVVRVEKKSDNNEEKLVAYAEGGSVLDALNEASAEILNISLEKQEEEDYFSSDLVNRVVKQGYFLQFFKLANKQVLATICGGDSSHYIPIKTVINSDIKSTYQELNASLSSLNMNYYGPISFYLFAESQMEPINNFLLHQEKIKVKTKKS